MKNRTPAMLISAAAVTSAALMGSCNNRDRSTTVAQSDTAPTEPVVRNGAVVAPQSGLTSSRDEVATSPATTRDPAAAPMPSPTDTDARVAGAENPDPPTPAERTRDQFVFDQNQNDPAPAVDTRYGRADVAPNSVESDPYAREDENPAQAWTRAEIPRDTQSDTDTRRTGEMPLSRDLPGSDSAREHTMGPSPTRVTSNMPDADSEALYTQRPLTDDRSPEVNWDENVNRTTRSIAPDNSKAPDPPTPATPTRESFQFDTARSDQPTSARTDATTRPDERIDTEDDLWETTDSSRDRSEETTRASDANRATPALATDRSKAPDPPTPATPTQDSFDFSSETPSTSQYDPAATTPAAPVSAEEKARTPESDRDPNRDRTSRASRLADGGNQSALYESGGEVYPVSPESRILAIIHAKNMDEIALGQLALERSSSPEVQAYARELISEHERADQRVRELASQKGYTLAEPALVNRMLARENAERVAPSARDHLKDMEGKSFDDAFTDHMTKGHAELITLMRHAAPSIQDDEVYALIDDLIPVIEDHQTAAYQLTANY